MSVNDFLLDFAVASVFILLGQLIRAKVKFVQRFFIPASMLAGFMGLTVRYLLPELLHLPPESHLLPELLSLPVYPPESSNCRCRRIRLPEKQPLRY